MLKQPATTSTCAPPCSCCGPRSARPLAANYRIDATNRIDRTTPLQGLLSKDYELLTPTSEAVIHLAITRLLLRRLTGHELFQTSSMVNIEVSALE